MRARPSEYELIAPGKLSAVLELLAQEPGSWMPIAGGTELMVQFSAGRLAARKLVSLWGLPELSQIETTAQEVTIGAGCTYSDLRNHPVVAQEFPLLVRAASWTGSIANQNRGTLGGNIVNASPAADTPPALLAYDATLTLISAAGTRIMPYRLFHLGYKKTALAPDELLYSVTIARKFSDYRTYTRKVGTRNAQAISKVALACLALMKDGIVSDIRIGAASLRETPARCTAAEQSLLNQPITPATIAAARAALATQARPIDDIRSTAKYRAAVAANLLEEFLHLLQ
jgi:CO/xanthine dehydrogenase FAD-binding subunit